MTLTLIEPPTSPFPLSAVLSDAVFEFGKQRGFHAEARHHDDPVWYVSDDRLIADWTTTRYVQVATFIEDSSPGAVLILLTPGAFAVNEKKHMALEQKKAQPSINLTITSEDNYESVRRRLDQLLEDAWSVVEKLDPNNIETHSQVPLT